MLVMLLLFLNISASQTPLMLFQNPQNDLIHFIQQRDTSSMQAFSNALQQLPAPTQQYVLQSIDVSVLNQRLNQAWQEDRNLLIRNGKYYGKILESISSLQAIYFIGTGWHTAGMAQLYQLLGDIAIETGVFAFLAVMTSRTGISSIARDIKKIENLKNSTLSQIVVNRD